MQLLMHNFESPMGDVVWESTFQAKGVFFSHAGAIQKRDDGADPPMARLLWLGAGLVHVGLLPLTKVFSVHNSLMHCLGCRWRT
jgi:hypothetical protein